MESSLSPKWKSQSEANKEVLSEKEIDSLSLSKEQLLELCLSMFLAYYGSSRMRNYKNRIEEELNNQAKKYSKNQKINPENLLNIKLNEEVYTFVGNHNSSYFLMKNSPRNDEVITSFLTEKFFPSDIRGNPLKSGFCVAKNYFTYHVARSLQNSKVELDEFIGKIKFPDCSPKGCGICLDSLNNISFDNFDESEVGYLFGGKFMKVTIPFKLLKMFLENNSQWYSLNKEIEEAYCTLLGYVLSNDDENIKCIINDKLNSPHYSEEVDLLFIKNNKGVIFEVSMSDKLSPKYVKDKVHNHYMIKEQLELDSLKTIIILMNRDVEIRKQLLVSNLSNHILNFKDKFSAIGYDDRFPDLTDSSYFDNGFMLLRDIFSDIFTKMENELKML
ncbi:MAG: hypothetical protein V1888_04040 [archaeon]